MGSKTFDGVWFEAYSLDHPPPHVHGFYAGVEVVVELTDLGVRLSPKQSHVNRILRKASIGENSRCGRANSVFIRMTETG